MKLRLILLLLIVFGITFNSSAQYKKKGRKSYKKHGSRGGNNVSSAGTIAIGVRGGVALTTLDNNPYEDFSEGQDVSYQNNLGYSTGLQAGAVVNVGLTNFLSVQPELLYIQKGAKADGTFSETTTEGPVTYKIEGNYEATIKSTYIEAPLLLKANFGTGSFSGFITAGPTLGYWLKGESTGKAYGKATMTYTNGTETFTNSDEDTEEVNEKTKFDNDEDGKEKRFETGLSFGTGIGYKLGNGTLNLDIRYGIGLSSIVEPRAEINEKDYKNRVFGVSIAYLFSL